MDLEMPKQQLLHLQVQLVLLWIAIQLELNLIFQPLNLKNWLEEDILKLLID